MIYDHVKPEEPIRQGDIFRGIPRLDINLDDLTLFSANNTALRSTWLDAISADPSSPLVALVGIRAVSAIVLTQDCDAVRAPDIVLSEIRPFKQVELRSKDTTATKSWVSLLTQHARVNQKWYYLPPDQALAFDEKMAADFRIVLRVERDNIESLKSTLRIGRLNDVALAHFRERIGEFFRRYPYDEWYPLNRDELSVYQDMEKPTPIHPFPWQT